MLCASGNDGRDADANRRIDAATVGSPATAKNALTVGATEGSEAVGFFGTWATMQFDGRVFANAVDRADPVAGQPDRMALLSSAGPTTDGRIKPDVCAPGTDIVGPQVVARDRNGLGTRQPVPALHGRRRHVARDRGRRRRRRVAPPGLAGPRVTATRRRVRRSRP